MSEWAPPEVGSSMKTMEGLATSSTAMVSLLRCSTDSPLWPGRPTTALLRGSISTRPSTYTPVKQVNTLPCSTKTCWDGDWALLTSLKLVTARNTLTGTLG